MTRNEILEIIDLKTYFFTDQGVVRAVDGVNLTIGTGESVGLVGESGSGKSMTAFSVLRLVPDPPGKIISGRILLKGEDLLQLTEKEMRSIRGKKIAMIFQEPSTSMNPSFTIGSQIEEAIRFHQGGKQSTVRDKALNLLQSVKIPDPARILTQYPHELSGGMLQRVMIAIGLSCEPDLLICDEPTTALDVSTQAQIITLLNELRSQRKTSFLFITHDLGVLSWICTFAAVMYAGKIVEYADIRSLILKPRHPYTRALIGASPRLDCDREALNSIPGAVPDLVNPPQGCRFHPRCSSATSICSNEIPTLQEEERGHWVACFARSNGKEAENA
ncbi:MAG TPA: ABC transporter ATP-binding protein [Syntrophorhabdales bacterium]|nr:ABC transporter ATP-binding protein [Syntrophorhabdales bacterium]